jgi:hypothetical protein
MRRGGAGGRKTTLFVSLAGGVVLVLGLAQVILPRIAASRVSSRVARYGSVQSVSVTAWPAIELLWGDAHAVRIRAKSLALSPTQVAKLLWEARGATSVDIEAEALQLGSLHLHEASLRKRGSSLSAAALLGEADVAAALPDGVGIELLGSEGGQVKVRASGGLFGLSASVDALALASAGKLIAHPQGFLLDGLRLTLFADRHVYVTGVGASIVSAQPRLYRLTITATLR